VPPAIAPAAGARQCAARGLDHGGGGRGRRARERWVGFVLDPELNALRNGVAGQPCGKPQRHVNAGRHAGRRDDLAVDHHALAHRSRAELGETVEHRPVRGGSRTLQQAGGAEHEGAGADRRRPARGGVRGAQPVEHAHVGHDGSHVEATGDEDHLGARHVGERGARNDAHAGVGAAGARLGRDPAHPGAGQEDQHLRGTDGIERRHPIEGEHRNFHGGDRTPEPDPLPGALRSDSIRKSDQERYLC